MRKVFLIMSAILIVFASIFSLAACSDKEPVKYDPISILNVEGGICFSHGSLTQFYYVLDEDAAVPADSGVVLKYSAELGEHTLRVYSLDSAGKEIAASTFSYTTVNLALSDLSVSGRTVVWTASAMSVSVKEKSDYVPVVGNSYTASSDNVTIRVKAQGGFDSSTSTYYAGTNVIKSATVYSESVTVLSKPSLEFDEKVMTWSRAVNAVGYAVSYDGGEYVEAESASISDEVGPHTIAVKALGDGLRYADSLPSIYSYETLRASLSVTKTASGAASVISEATVHFSVDREDYMPIDGDLFEVEESCTIYFKAFGFDRAENKNYIDSEVVSADFVATAVREIVIEDASDENPSDRWAREVFVNNDWSDADTSVFLAKRYDGSAALCLQAPNNHMAYRFSLPLALSQGYDTLSFYYCGDGISELKVSLGDQESGYYIRRDLGVMPAYWVKVTLRLDDEDWLVNGFFSLPHLWEMRKSEEAQTFDVPESIVNAFSLYELVPFFDRISFTLIGDDGQGASSTSYLDDLCFDFDPEVADGVAQPLFAVGSSYVAYETLAGGSVNEWLLFLDNDSQFRLYSTALENNIILNGRYVIDDQNASIALSASDYSLLLTFADNGMTIRFEDGSQEIASHLTSHAFLLTANLLLDFEDGETDEVYTNDDWKVYSYFSDEGWRELTTPQINCREKNASQVINLATGRHLTNKFVYREEGANFGIANYFSVEIGNYFEGADPIGVKIVAVDAAGRRHYLMGSENVYFSYPVTDNLELYTVSLPSAISPVSFEIVTYYTGENETSYLYLDNFLVRYKADESVFSGYAEPELSIGEYAVSFAHGDENAVLEYSVNDGEWVEGSIYAIPSVSGNYVLRVRGKIGSDEVLTKTAVYAFTVEEVFLTSISVSVGETGHTASWRSNGITSVKVDERTESGVVEGEFEQTQSASYFTDKNIVLTVRAVGYFDEQNKKYYVGSVELSKKILVDVVLDAPVITPAEEGLAWDAVEDSTAYAVSVNDGDYVVIADRLFPYSHNEGRYVVRVMSVLTDDNGEIIGYSGFGEYTYEVKPVRLTVSKNKSVVSWAAEACKVYLKLNNHDPIEMTQSFYKAEEKGGHALTIIAVAGFDPATNIYYTSEADVERTATVVVKTMATPVFQINSEGTGLYWNFANDDTSDEDVATVEDMINQFPFITYQISVNEGEWQDADAYLFPTVPGEYSVRVKTRGNDANYLDSAPSAPFVFTVKQVALSPITITEQSEEQTTASYEFSALRLYRWFRALSSNEDYHTVGSLTAESTLTTTSTVNVFLCAEGGFDRESFIYYAGEAIMREKLVVVPVYLDAPSVDHDRDGITWTSVKNATHYSVSINGGEPIFVTNNTMTYESTVGDYQVAIKAVNLERSEEFPDSQAAVITYHIVQVAISDELEIQGARVSWTSQGIQTIWIEDNELGGEALFEPYSENYYLNESGADVTVHVKVEPGYDHDRIVRYIGDPIERELPVKESQLLAPVLKLQQGQSGLVWEQVGKVSAYRYKELSGSASDAEVEEAASTESGWTDVGGLSLSFNTTEGSYILLIKAVGGLSTIKDSLPSLWRYSVRQISLSEITVDQGVASWSKVGITTIREIRTINGQFDYGAFVPIDDSTYAPTETLSVDLWCSAGYDTDHNVYYVGSTIKRSIEIIVPTGLSKPDVTFTANGIVILAMGEYARFVDHYEIKVGSGEYLSIERTGSGNTETIYSLSNSVGDYDLRIRACNSVNPEQYPSSADAEISYSVREVALNSISDNDQGGASIVATGLLSLKEEGGEYGDFSGSTYSPAASTTVYVKASAGVDTVNHVKYIGTMQEASAYIVVPIKLATPKLTEQTDRLSIGRVQNATSYLVSIDGAAPVEQSGLSVSYSSAVGDHTITVTAHSSDSKQYPNSDPVTLTYKTKALSLSDVSVSGATFSWTAVAHTVKISLTGNAEDAVKTTDSSYKATSVGKTTLTVYAYKGYLASSHTYYYSSSASISKFASVTISKLSAPSLSVSGNKIVWSAVSGATDYSVKVNSGSYASTGGSREKAFATQDGTYTVQVKAIGNGSTVLDSDASSYTYKVSTVTLSNISVVGAKASWSATALKTSISVDGESYRVTTDTSYTVDTDGTHTIKVKAEGGWNASSKVYYYTSSPIEKTATVKVTTLAKPVLKTNSKGVTWSAVSNAGSYSVKIDDGSYKTQSDRNVAFSTSTGIHTVYVKAIAAANSAYADSAAATFTYETKQTAFDFLTTSSTKVTWAYTGLCAQYSTDGGTNYVDTTRTGYTASGNSTVKFRAVGGWDSSANVFYNGTTSAQSKTFSLPGLFINFESGLGNWVKEYFNGNTNSWATASAASVSLVTDAYGAGNAIKLHSYLNGNSYRFGYSFGDLPGNYKSLSFDIKINSYLATGTTFRFQDSASGTYVDYKIEHLPLSTDTWYHVSIGFEDANLIINSGNKEYTAPKACSLLGESNYYSKIKALDKMYVMVNGNASNGVDAYTFIDNFQFSTAVVNTATKSKITTKEVDFNDGSVSGWNQYKYQDNSYVSAGAVSIANASDNDRVLNLYAGGTTYKYTYNEGGSTSLGSVNHFSVDLGGDKNYPVSYRIELITKSGSTIYAAGGENYMAVISSPNGISSLQTLNFNFTQTEIKSIIIYATSSSGHLFLDNVVLTKV